MSTNPSAVEDRTYRFGPLDLPTWALGLTGAQCGLLAVGVLLAGGLLEAHFPAPVVLAPAAACALLAFASWNGRPVREWLPLAARHVTLRVKRRDRWFAGLQGHSVPGFRPTSPRVAPAFLDGIEIVDAIGGHEPTGVLEGMGVASDRRLGTLSATVVVSGGEFSLAERPDQERIVQSWGEALAAFSAERGPVSRVRVTEWSGPLNLWSGAAASLPATATLITDDDYESLVSAARADSVRHEALVTVTVDRRRLAAVGRRRGNEGASEALVEEVRLLTARLELAGFGVSPLSRRQLADVVQRRMDPFGSSQMSRGTSLADMARLGTVEDPSALAVYVEWPRIRIDSSCHRTFWIAQWPMLDVGPNWLEPFLFHAGGVRTFSIHYEPVPPSRSRRTVERDTTRLAVDEQQRSHYGLRVGVRHRRSQAAVSEREHELVAGYSELEFSGFLTVTAPDPEALELRCGEYEQIAAQAGLELRALEGRQDLGFVCSLPIGRGIATRRFT